VYFGLNYFRFESEFKTWLYRVVINKINNHFRKQKLRSVFSAELKEEMSEDAGSSTFNENRLFEMTNKLPRFQRNIVLLRVYQDLSFKMIGEILNITENSAKVSFHKAKANLKIHYMKKYDEYR
jgi:RNA polymerase sigma-70 factor (ECF subfamily)